MKARIVKMNRPSRYMYQVKNVTIDKKYKYFVVTTKIYHHEIIQTIPFDDCDYIELYEDRAEYGMIVTDNKERVIKVIRKDE